MKSIAGLFTAMCFIGYLQAQNQTDSSRKMGAPGGHKPNAGSIRILTGLEDRKLVDTPVLNSKGESYTVTVQIMIDSNGVITEAMILVRGTTTTNSEMRSVALKKAQQLRFTAGPEKQVGIIQFRFRGRNEMHQ